MVPQMNVALKKKNKWAFPFSQKWAGKNENTIWHFVMFLHLRSIPQPISPPKIVTANNSNSLSSTFYVLHPRVRHPWHSFFQAVSQSSFLLRSWERGPALCDSDSTEVEAAPRTEHWSAEKQAGCQQVLCRRMVSGCEEMHRCEKTETEVKKRGGKHIGHCLLQFKRKSD